MFFASHSFSSMWFLTKTEQGFAERENVAVHNVLRSSYVVEVGKFLFSINQTLQMIVMIRGAIIFFVLSFPEQARPLSIFSVKEILDLARPPLPPLLAKNSQFFLIKSF